MTKRRLRWDGGARLLFAAALVACAFASAVVDAAIPARAQGALPQAVQEATDEARKECLPDKFEMLAGFQDVRDVNGDGRSDYILDYGKATCAGSAGFYCGSAGCVTQVFASLGDGSYVKVLDENVRRLRFARVKGRPAMLLDLHGSACGRAGAAPCAFTLLWNGKTFGPAK
jgi:hypothetical protein